MSNIVLRDFRAEKESDGWHCFKPPHNHLRVKSTTLKQRIKYIVQQAEKRNQGA